MADIHTYSKDYVRNNTVRVKMSGKTQYYGSKE